MFDSIRSPNRSHLPVKAEPRCSRCDGLLGPLPPAARFCPRCGLPIAPQVHGALPSEMPTAYSSSLIVEGYANAMYTLGRRYEVARNRSEARRCFYKSARLGNIFAMTRLPWAWTGSRPTGADPVPVLSLDESKS